MTSISEKNISLSTNVKKSWKIFPEKYYYFFHFIVHRHSIIIFAWTVLSSVPLSKHPFSSFPSICSLSLSFFLMSFFWFFSLKYIWQNLKQCKNKNREGSKEQSRWMKNISTFFGIVHKTGTFTTNVSLLAYYILAVVPSVAWDF